MRREIFLALFFKSQCNYNRLYLASPFLGGYENFHSQYPELCTEVKTIDHSGTETEKRVNSQTENRHHKPDYDQVWKTPRRASDAPTQSAQSGTCANEEAIFNPVKRGLAASGRLVFDIKNIHFVFSDLRCSRTWSGKFTFIPDLSPICSTAQIRKKGTLVGDNFKLFLQGKSI